MENATSHQGAASLPGPSSRLPRNVIITPSPVTKRVFTVTVPHRRTNGDYLKIKVDNKDTTIQIPSVAKLGRKILFQEWKFYNPSQLFGPALHNHLLNCMKKGL
jgi:hypothetical protein